MNMTHTFQVGQTYEMRSPGDHDCRWTYKVTARTAKTVTLADDQGDVIRRGIRIVFGTERVLPLGSYSLCPVLTAEKLVTA